MTKLRVIEGNRQRKPKPDSAKMRLPKLRATTTSLRPFLFAVIFTAAAIVIDTHPVLVGETASGIMPIVCIIAAWCMTCAAGRASLILGATVLLSCGAALLYLPESAYAPVTAMMLQGHVVAATRPRRQHLCVRSSTHLLECISCVQR